MSKPKIPKEIFFERFRKKFGNSITLYEDEYIDTQKEIHFKCNKCGYIFKRRPHNCLASDGCPKCNHVTNQKLENEEFKKRANIIHKYKYDYSESEYKSTDEEVIVICHEKDEFGEEHGRFKVTPHAHIGCMHSGCPKCSKKFGSEERFKKLANLKYNGLYTYNNFVYNGAFNESYVTCKIHGDFLVSPNRHLNGQMCPKCLGSTMEKEISAFLDDNGIEHYMRKHFDWLGKQEIDIFIPKHNVAIECQGEQHFKPIKFYGGENEFKKIKQLDETKRKLCEENGIKLLYYSNLSIDYPYQVFENKKELLKEIIK